MIKTRMLGLAALGAVALAGCTTTDPYTGQTVRDNTRTGALAGALGGAAVGYATNTNNSRQGRRNAMIGAGVGALAGAAVAGNYMDRQQAQLRAQLQGTGVNVERRGDDLVLLMPGDVTFDVDRAEIQPRFFRVLDGVADTLNQYPSTYIDVVGHADATGSDEHNQQLSERRANSVAGYLVGKRVQQARVYVAGLGETAPIASNATPDGRAQNRRVEIVLRPYTG
jgi:outer membrane protein OmpA-like peptidoglycan-associated protein